MWKTRGPWLAAGTAALLDLPHLAWQVAHGIPTLEFYHNARAGKILPMTPWGFVGAQLTLLGPGNALLWLAGLGWLLRAPGGRPYRLLGMAYLLLLALLIGLGAKAYYLAPFYPVLFAAGGAAFEDAARAWRGWLARGLLSTAAALRLVLGVAIAPLALPILSPQRTVAYGRALGLSAPQAERNATAELPQHFADMFGWKSLVGTLAQVRDSLPAPERPVVQIVVHNYGEAGAVDLLGGRHGLPAAHAPHNAYWMWGPPDKRDGPVIVLGTPSDQARAWAAAFSECVEVTRTRCDYCMPYERELPVFVCKGWRRPPAEVWAEIKRYF